MTELRIAGTVAELRDLASWGRPLAGGTDLLVQMRDGRDEPRLVDVTNLRDAPPVVARRDGWVEVSAFAPISRVVQACGAELPALAQAAAVFGSLQIRNRATIGGNLANASPAADMVPPLVAAEAVAVVEDSSLSHEIPVDGLAAGPGETVLEPGEWISRIAVPLPAGEEGFRKLGGRSAMAISLVSLAWRWLRREDGVLVGVRIALGAVAPVVIRAGGAEAELEGRRPTADVVDRAVMALRSAVSPIDDVRASAWYRREVAGQLLREVLGR